MAGKHVFRPTDINGREQLEARVVLSQSGVAHFLIAHAHGHHGPVHHAVKGHGKVAHHGTGTNHNNGPVALSNPGSPVVTVSIPVGTNANPSSQTPVSTPTSTSTPTPTQLPTLAGVPSVSGVMSAQEQTIVTLVNQQRALAGLAPLQANIQLTEAAQIHSEDMAKIGQMLHVLPGATLPSPVDRAGYVGYNYSWLGENIAFNYPDDNSVMVAWMNSPEHRDNILNPNYTQIGVGIAQDSQGQPYYTQEFGKPA